MAVCAALGLSGCGTDGGAPEGVAAPAPAVAVPVVPVAPVAAPAEPVARVPKRAVAAPAAPAPVRAEKPAPTALKVSARAAAQYEAAAEARAARARVAWEAPTLAALRDIDERLVADEAATVGRVRASCGAINGMFAPQAVELVRERFSSRIFQLTEAMAQNVYEVILQVACYPMSG